MQQPIQLLNQVGFALGTMREARKRFSSQLAPEFRLFDFLRTDEMGLSTCIASLLDPKGTHGQGHAFLEAFLEMHGLDSEWMDDAKNCEVVTEKTANGLRRIDIYLDFPNVGVVGIENKPWAGDQDQQLSDYAAYLEKVASGKRWLLIYLSNREPTEESIKRGDRERMEEGGLLVRDDYDQLIRWLDICAHRSKALVVRVFIEELIKFIRAGVNGEMDMSEENETCGIILNSKENIGSAFQVAGAINAVKKSLLLRFRNTLLAHAQSRGFHIVWDDSLDRDWKSNIGFGFKFKAGQSLYLRFQFEGSGLNGLFWGIRREADSVPYDEAQWGSIHTLMQEQFGLAQGRSEWWPWYAGVKSAGLDRDLKNWWMNSRPWEEIMEGGESGLVRKIAEVADRTHQAFETNLDLLD